MNNPDEKTMLHRKNYDPDARGPLNGIRVLDLSRLVCGNVLSLQLADFGAEVIKVEPPDGDSLRAWRVKGIETSWKVYSRNKKSICIDLRNPEGVELVRKLTATAQIFMESFRPGVIEEMGIGPEELLKINPALVIIRISGWGQTGPFRHKPGFGTLVEGYSSCAAINGYADREPLLPPHSLADMTGALYGATAALVALRNSELGNGQGQVIDLPLFEPTFSTLGPRATNYRLTGRVPPRRGNRSSNSAPRNAYETKDKRWVALSASTQGMTEKLFRAIDRADLIENPKFRTNSDRLANIDELDAIIGGRISELTLAEALAYFDQAGVTIGPMNDISQVMADHYVIEREALIEVPDEDMGYLPMHNVIPRLSGTPGSLRSPAPKRGFHNAEVVEAVVGAAEYQRLVEAGVLQSDPSLATGKMPK